MKRLFVLLFLAFGFLQAQDQVEPIYNEITTGNGFARRCSVFSPYVSEKTQLEQGDMQVCAGYVSGLVDGMVVMESATAHSPFCIPTNKGQYEVENGQIMHILFKYIREHPEKAHEATAVLLLRALRQGFPCGSGTRR